MRERAEAHAFTAFWLLRGRVLAGMHVNDWDAASPIKAIVGAVGGRRPARPGVPLEQVVAPAGAD